MSVVVQACGSCAARWFPDRLLCPACGGSDLVPEAEEQGVVEETSTLPDGAVIATVRLAHDVRVIARLLGDGSTGATVWVTHDPHDARRPMAHVPTPSTDERTSHD